MLRPILGISTATYGGTYRGPAEVQAAATASARNHDVYAANFQGSSATTNNIQLAANVKPDLSKQSGESEDHLLGGSRPTT